MKMPLCEFRVLVHCPTDKGVDGQTLENMPFVPSVNAQITIGGSLKTVTAQSIELNNWGWDASSSVSITVE